jgi:hypothetical protein
MQSGEPLADDQKDWGGLVQLQQVARPFPSPWPCEGVVVWRAHLGRSLCSLLAEPQYLSQFYLR